MSKSIYFILIAIIAVTVLPQSGINSTAILCLVAVAALLAIPLYFSTRNRSRPPSHVERLVATAWVWLRRVLGVGAGTAMVAGAFHVATTGWLSNGVLDRLGTALFFLLMGAFLIYVGIIGQGTDRHQWEDDAELHKKNKRRYGWRF